MKNFLGLLTAFFTALFISVFVYAADSEPFSSTLMESDGVLYSNYSPIGDVYLPERMADFYVTEDYIYYVYFSENKAEEGIYRCKKDLSDMTLIKNCYADNVMYCCGIIYYVDHTNDDFDMLCSIDTDTLQVTKHLTHSNKYSLRLYCINSDYIYFSVSDKRISKLYRQNINNPVNKKLLYLSKTNNIYNCIVNDKSIYIETSQGITILNKSTGMTTGTGASSIDLIGSIDNKIYACDFSANIYSINEVGTLQEILTITPEKGYNELYTANITGNKIYLSVVNITNNETNIEDLHYIYNPETDELQLLN